MGFDGVLQSGLALVPGSVSRTSKPRPGRLRQASVARAYDLASCCWRYQGLVAPMQQGGAGLISRGTRQIRGSARLRLHSPWHCNDCAGPEICHHTWAWGVGISCMMMPETAGGLVQYGSWGSGAGPLRRAEASRHLTAPSSFPHTPTTFLHNHPPSLQLLHHHSSSSISAVGRPAALFCHCG